MGLKFYENTGGTKMYFCASCFIYMADKASLVSTSFTGVSGQAYLFKRVVNVSFGPMVQRTMMTGPHYVRDAFCVSCDEKIGWMYEMAPNDDERYKEGSVILERLHILEMEGITKNSQMEPRSRRQFEVNHDAFARLRDGQRLQVLHRQEVDRLHNFNDVFRFNRARDPPVVSLFDEQQIAESFGFDEEQMMTTRLNVQRLNDAIVSCSRGNNTDLWMLGFRADIARQFREIRNIMDGEPFIPSRGADHSLVMLFDRMRRERDRMHFNEPGQFDLLEFDRFMAQNEAFVRAHAQTRTQRILRERDRIAEERDRDRLAHRAELEMMINLEGLFVANPELREQL